MRAWQVGTVVALVLAWCAPSATAAIELDSTGRLSDRLAELTFTTDALNAPTKVRVLTPAGYDPDGRRRYPVLLLLHGAIDDYRSWTDKGAAEAATAGLPLIVVMPDGGQFGNYTDWYNDGAFGPPEWERYHIRQLLPWVDAHYRTLGTRAGRAVAGLSMGGGGAMKYAAAYPDRFTAAYGFSAAVNTNDPSVMPVTQLSGLSDGSMTPGAIYGLRQQEEIRWRNENPTDLAENLGGLDLALITRNGQAGASGTGDPVEQSVHAQSLAMHDRLLELGIPHLWDDQGAGGHDWAFWQKDLVQVLPGLMARFAAAPARPARITYKRADGSFSAYGWRVHVERPAPEFAALRGASRRGFSLSGSGVGTVRTPRFFAPRSRVRVRIANSTATARVVRAGPRGRVRLTVPLGQGNPAQQYTAGATTKVFTSHVQLRGPRR